MKEFFTNPKVELFIQYFAYSLFFVLAPVFVGGIIRKIRARVQNRRGPNILQSFYDILRLFQKEPIDGPFSGFMAIYAPLFSLYFAAILWSLVVFEWGSFILIPFLLGGMRFCMAGFAMETGTSFGGLGASREILLSVVTEPILILIVLVASSSIQFPLSPSSFILGILFFSVASIAILAEVKKPPFDDPRTHLELTMVHEAMLLEASGKTMAMFEMASALKLSSLVVLLLRLAVEHSQLKTLWSLYTVGFVIFGFIFYVGYIGFWEGISVRRKWSWVSQVMGMSFIILLILGTLLKLG